MDAIRYKRLSMKLRAMLARNGVQAAVTTAKGQGYTEIRISSTVIRRRKVENNG
jgi:hypothetical protein